MIAGTFHALKTRQATWLELFFDLVFVAVIGVLAHALAHTHDGKIYPGQFFQFLGVFVPVWWVWSTHTLFANRYDSDNRPHRFLTLGIMALVILLSTFTKEWPAGGFVGFALAYAAMRVCLGASYWLAARSSGGGEQLARGMARAILLGAGVSAASVLFESELKYVLLYGGLLLDAAMQARLNKLAAALPVHKKHLAERIGLLAIIVLGETVISLVGTLSVKEFDGWDVVSAVAGFTLIAQIWWIYFGSLHRLERAKKTATGNVMMYSHLIFYIGLIFLANLVRHAIVGDLARPAFAAMAVAGMTLFYLGKQIPYIAAFPPYRNGIILNSAVCIFVTAASALLPRVEYSLVGMTFGMFVYVQLNVRWLIPKYNVEEYLEAEEE